MNTASREPRRPSFSRRSRAHVPMTADVRLLERLWRLPETCEQIVLLPVPQEDLAERAEIALRFLPYAEVMRLALRLPAVRSVVALLPADFSDWAR